MKKLLIISTYHSLNGISSYVNGLRDGLAGDFDIDVVHLDHNILRSQTPAAVRAGNEIVKKIVTDAQKYDFVNLHWRGELFGNRIKDQLQRLDLFAQGIDRLVLTMHDPLPNSHRITPRGLVVTAYDHGARALVRLLIDPNRGHVKRFVRTLKLGAKDRGLTVVAPNKRERRQYERVLELPRVYDHPPCFVRTSWLETLNDEAKKKRQKMLASMGSDAIILGVFGLIKNYKGIDTAIRALRFLPDNYHLCIFGGIDPMDIRERKHIDDVLNNLIAETNREGAFFAYLSAYAQKMLAKSKSARPLLKVASPDGVRLELPIPPEVAPAEGLSSRVHFVDTHGDQDFCAAVAAVDVCLFPYIEANKSYSGTAHHAVELNKKTITSNNRCFGELSKYFPGKIQTFDIGNYIQLAQRIEQILPDQDVDAPFTYEKESEAAQYSFTTQIEMYRKIFGSYERS